MNTQRRTNNPDEQYARLQKLVDERTAELRQAMERLQKETEERRRAEERSLDAERRYRTLFHESPYGVLIVDPNTTRIQEANEPACRQLGYSTDAITRLRIMDFEAEETPEATKAHIERIMASGGDCFDTVHRTQGGDLRNMRITIRSLKLAGRDMLLYVIQDITGHKQDEVDLREYQERLENTVAARTSDLTLANAELRREISERRAIEENLRSAIKQLEENDQTKSDFVTNVSHELKTPITTISNCIENLLAGVVGAVPDRMRSYLLMMEEDCQRLAATIGDILDLSRIDAKRMVLNRVKLPFARFVQRAAESLRVQADNKGICLTLKAPNGLGFVECDPQKMERVVLNIVQNAINYTPEAGEIEVSVERHASKAAVILHVTDNGIGIPAEFLDRVTERYFRIGEHVKGAGIGLALSQEMVHLHHGAIDIKSPPEGKNRGTHVSVWLPMAAPARVLILDDDRQVLDVLAEQLGHFGYSVTTSDSGANALKILETCNPDVLILDLIMPGLNGLDVISQIKANRDMHNLPLVVLTGAGVDQTRMDLLASLRIPVVGKPWEAQKLLESVELSMIGRYWGSGNKLSGTTGSEEVRHHEHG